MSHRFERSAADFACGAQTLVLSRADEYRKQHGVLPHQLLLHVATARQLFSEFAQQHGLPEGRIPVPGDYGQYRGIPFAVCTCGDDLGEDQIIDANGKTEPL